MKTAILIRHTGIVVSDIDLAIQFYCDLLGFSVKVDQIESGKHIDRFLGLESTRVRTVKLSLGEGSMLELLSFLNPNALLSDHRGLNSLGYTHIALTVDDIDSLYVKLKNFGCELLSKPQMSPDKKVKLCFCRDPEGNYLELVQELNG